MWELPPIKPHVTEYQRHRLACPCCGETTCAELPPGVPQGQSGPRLMAFTALLMAYYRQSKRRTAEFLDHPAGSTVLCGVDGEDANPSHGRRATGVRGVGGRAADGRARQRRRNADQRKNGKAWLWTFVARMFTVFAVRATREATAVDEFLTAAFVES